MEAGKFDGFRSRRSGESFETRWSFESRRSGGRLESIEDRGWGYNCVFWFRV
jgi:hypothetical protein